VHVHFWRSPQATSLALFARERILGEFADAALWVEPVPGSRSGLQALADAGVRVGIVSNADGLMGQRLAQLELCQVGPGLGVPLECVVDSGNVGVMKPDPRIFHAGAQTAGVAPAEVLHVGDDAAMDVLGALGAGMQTVWVNRQQHAWSHAEQPHHTVTSLQQLVTLML